ncbi:unnamed protein product [Rotaria sp. Silwood2]|nr:unnamed protein product [Rotaria sp. Silwood2]
MYTKPFKNLDEASTIICTAFELQDASGMNLISYFMKEARRKNDASILIQAYTAETDFYRRLNHLLAQLPFQKYTTEDRNRWYVQYVAIIDTSSQFAKFGWKGITYRGMMVTEEDLNEYKIGDWIVNNAFLSTSKDRAEAEKFICVPKPNKIPLITKYLVTRDRSALDISSTSEFKDEQEVLILPNAVFKVATIMRDKRPIEIELSDK